jgi:hypothetical protein
VSDKVQLHAEWRRQLGRALRRRKGLLRLSFRHSPDQSLVTVQPGGSNRRTGDRVTVPALVGGHLPMGRWVCSRDEVEMAFVPAVPTDPRRLIWEQWMDLTDALQRIVGEVAACWLSGSFFSDKPVPGDIDCLYVVDTDRLATVVARGRKDEIAFVRHATTGKVKETYGLRIDSYIMEWVPTPGPIPGVGAQRYLSERGYWDDLWVRVKDNQPRLDSIPRRGYLEVIVDGYR